MRLKIGISPCPNDTFMFDALINKKIEIKDIELDILLADVEKLNKMAFEEYLDITKISYHAYAYISNNYQLLSSGSALGLARLSRSNSSNSGGIFSSIIITLSFKNIIILITK